MNLEHPPILFFMFLLTLLPGKSTTAILTMASTTAPLPYMERRLSSPVYDAIAYNNYINYIGSYGGNPWSFTPYASLYTNPFSNPNFAQNFPTALRKTVFGPQMLNYLTYMNPLLYGPMHAATNWQMGDFGMGSALSSPAPVPEEPDNELK